MPRIELPSPTLRLSRAEARRFLLMHQHLWPPRSLADKVGILDFIRHVGCIQYDPVNLVGQNPELVLQAHVADYTPALFAELLYADRTLVDGWDKRAAIHRAEDWPYFARHHDRARREHGDPANPPMAIAETVRDAIRERGSALFCRSRSTMSSIDWWWGVPTRLGRAALEILYGMGEVGVHHRVNTRRYFDLIERLLPADLLAAADPNPTDEAYQDWHFSPAGGLVGPRQPGRGRALARHRRRHGAGRSAARGIGPAGCAGRADPVAVEGISQAPLFIRAADVLLARWRTPTGNDAPPTAAFIGPLDNLIWDRDLIRQLFEFDYTWEVYKPAAQRKYGHYVLPVLYGDRFIARVEPIFDRKARVLTIVNWWWEAGVVPDEAMIAALAECLARVRALFGRGGNPVGRAGT